MSSTVTCMLDYCNLKSNDYDYVTNVRIISAETYQVSLQSMIESVIGGGCLCHPGYNQRSSTTRCDNIPIYWQHGSSKSKAPDHCPLPGPLIAYMRVN